MQISLVSLIHQAKPTRALFTTFTFSIAWFEAIVIPALRSTGCTQIDVLVDAREACKSTDDANSQYAGSAYRIIPVFMPGTTVFHPKLAYFEGKDSDSLVIGSANLTLSGHGRNLEVLDAVNSTTEPGVFEEFSEFLESLVGLHDFAPENLDVLLSYQSRALFVSAAAGSIDSAMRKAWLVHTLERTAAEQLVGHAARLNGANRATILSPYHSPSGTPVINLARELQVDNIRIGLNALALTIPFRTAIQISGNEVHYVTANTTDSSRVLHAKCFEVEGESEVIVMTGSINATAQSFESTKNVEVSLVRLLERSPFLWDAAVPVAYAPCEFDAAEMTARNPALQATWTTSNNIVGLVQPAGLPQLVDLEVWEGDLCHATLAGVALLENGEFSVKMSEMFNASGALRLVLTGDTIHAVGWINVELELEADDTQRVLAKASSRMLSGDFDVSDLNAIFGWLESLQAQNDVYHTGGRVVDKQPPSVSQPTPDSKPSYQDWRESVDQYKGLGVHVKIARASLDAAFAWLDRDVKPVQDSSTDSRGTSEEEPGTPGKSALNEEDVPQTNAASKVRLLTTAKSEFTEADDTHYDASDDENYPFQRLLQSIPKALQLDATSAIVPVMVELAGGAVLKLSFRLLQTIQQPHQYGPDSHRMLVTWLMRFSGFAYSDVNREKLFPYFSAMACCALHYYPECSAATLKETLQRLAQRPITEEEIRESARHALSSRRFLRIGELDRAVIPATAGAISAVETLSQQLEALIVTTLGETKRSGTKTVGELGFVTEALRQHRHSSDRVFGVVADKPGQGKFCPCCFHVIQTDDQIRLRAARFFLCKNPCCNRPIFFGLDTAALARLGLSGRFRG